MPGPLGVLQLTKITVGFLCDIEKENYGISLMILAPSIFLIESVGCPFGRVRVSKC
jgi:hypothetical protein